MLVDPLAIGADPANLPPFTPVRLFTETELDTFLTTTLVVAAGLYLWGVRSLTARGIRWDPWRTVAWLAGGLGTIAFATMSGLGAYDDTLLSVHMVQHMVLSMISPMFLALGAPVTLALRTLPLRDRRRFLAVLHSRVAKVLTFPAVGWFLFVGTPFALYYSPVYAASLRHDWLHELLHFHFILVGCLFLWPLVGLDPVPGRVGYPFRLLLLFAALPFHAILGVSILGAHQLIGGDYYPSLALTWSNPVSDQKVAGGLLWGSGDIIGLLMLASVFVQWAAASEREAVREDRRIDRLEAMQAAAAVRAAGPGGATARPAHGPGRPVEDRPPTLTSRPDSAGQPAGGGARDAAGEAGDAVGEAVDDPVGDQAE
ncbi:MAG TPA: cytochrome c oxidase assembly protein [Mycobacteriales bacterium]|nr:cytochrome c oxidase assembly protein [Mycobacteriales bacterium]